jgi:hypothetical protein
MKKFVTSVLLSTALSAQSADVLRETDSVAVVGATKFVAAAWFVVNHPLVGQVPGIVKIRSLGNQGMPSDNFERYLLGKTEDAPRTVLTRYRLQKLVADSEIRGLKGFRPLQLAYVYELLVRQPRGESGFLLTNGSTNWFHVRGTDGHVWLLGVSWPDASGWWVQAVSIPILLPGSQVISY